MYYIGGGGRGGGGYGRLGRAEKDGMIWVNDQQNVEILTGRRTIR